MQVEFLNEPFVKELPILGVWLDGRDHARQCYVQCRVGAALLSKGAGGISCEKLRREFKRRRAEIEAAATRHYRSGDWEDESGVAIVWLNRGDLEETGQ